MEKIAENVYIQRYFSGYVGAIEMSKGVLCLDAPLLQEETRLWRGELMQLRQGRERMLVLLDMHPDRVLGARNMDMPVMAHRKMAEALASRPVTYRHEDRQGAWLEICENTSGLRWPSVVLSFTDDARIHWDEPPVVLRHAPGPRLEAVQVFYPMQKTIFVGDAVLREPPFLADADIPQWIETLNHLLKDDYKRHIIISSRSGPVGRAEVRAQIALLERILRILEQLEQDPSPDAISNQVHKLMKKYQPEPAQALMFHARLQYGLRKQLERRKA